MFGGGAVSYKAFGVHGLAQSQHHRAPGGNLGAAYLMLRRLPVTLQRRLLWLLI